MADAIQLSETPKAAVLTLNGNVCAQSDNSLGTALEKLGDLTGTVKAIDITSVAFIDSYALGQILFFCSSLRRNGQKAIIINSSSDESSYVNKLIEVAELSQVVEVVSDINAIGSGDNSNGS